MPIYIFSFSVDTETNRSAFAGNIHISQALSILQQLAIADGIQQGRLKEQVEEDTKGKAGQKVGKNAKIKRKKEVKHE